MKPTTPRDLALAILMTVDRPNASPDPYLDRNFRIHPHLSELDRAFTLHLVQGVMRWKLRLDWVIRHFVRFPFSRIQPDVLNILRMALYQIMFMDRVPDSASVDEAVRQAKSVAPEHVARFVNGILRQVCRTNREIRLPSRGEDPAAHLSVLHSYPRWIVEKWARELGMGEVELLLEAGNRIPELVIRANTRKTDRDGLMACLEQEGICASPTVFSPVGLKLDGLRGPVGKSRCFEKGRFQVQGEAAQICSYLLAPVRGETVLDLCAGVGGKSTHLAELMEDRGAVISLDRHLGRLISMTDNCRRLGLGIIRPVAGDALADVTALFRRRFDRVLVDAPCSGLGVLSKHPDGKWNRDEDDIKRLARLQKRLLIQAADLVERDGRMLYVTCTISKEENEGAVEAFLEERRDVGLLDLRGIVPPWARPLIDARGFFRTYPHVHGIEGFFAALMVKK
jgi:16S rRNA (cytosine967-C5)-methyltransferase